MQVCRYRYIADTGISSTRASLHPVNTTLLVFPCLPPSPSVEALVCAGAPAQTSASTLPTTVTQLLSRCYATATALQRSCYGTCADPAVHSSQLLPLQPALWQPQVAEAVMQCTASAEVPALLLPSSVSLGARHTSECRAARPCRCYSKG